MVKEEGKKGLCNFAAFDLFGSPVAFNIGGDESYKTVIGCVWSIVMLMSLIVTTGYYSLVFYQKSDFSVTSKIIVQSEFPHINFKENEFMFSIFATKGHQIVTPGSLSNFLSFRAIQYEVRSTVDSDGVRGGSNVTAHEIPFDLCSKAKNSGKIDDTSIRGKTSLALSSFSICSLAEADQDHHKLYLEGNGDSDLYAFVNLIVLPCDKTMDTCFHYYMNTTETDVKARILKFKSKHSDITLPASLNPDGITSTNAAAVAKEFDLWIEDLIRDYISDTYLTFNYVDATVEPENYDMPIHHTMNSNLKTHTSVNTRKNLHVFYRELISETDTGIFFESINQHTSISYDMSYVDIADRDLHHMIEVHVPGASEKQAVSTPYITYYLHSSNNLLVYSRTYMKIIDLFSNVGGCSQIFVFIVIFGYAWYNSIRMEQSLLNLGILGIDDNNKSLEPWEKSRVFTTWDLIRFGFIEKGFCCIKRDKKYALYKKCADAYESRTDVINIMKSISDISNIKEAMFSPYQIKLLNYIGVDQSQDDINDHQYGDSEDADDLNVRKALGMLKGNKKNQTIVQQALDSYLLKHLPKDIIEGNFEHLSIAKKAEVVGINKSSFNANSALQIEDLDGRDSRVKLKQEDLSLKQESKIHLENLEREGGEDLNIANKEYNSKKFRKSIR